MRPIPAIVEDQHEQVLANVRAKFSALREAETQRDKLGRKLEAATGAADMRRLELGKALNAARALWPATKAAQGGARGPGGKTWTQYLEAEGMSETTAHRYRKLAGWDGDESLHEKGPNQLPTYASLGMDNRPRGPLLVPDAPDFDPVPQPPAALPRPGFKLLLGDWHSVLVDAGMVDSLIVDPPYGKRTHDSEFRERSDGWEVDGLRPNYDAWSPEDVSLFVAHWAPRTRGWIVALTSHDLTSAWEAAYLAAGRYSFAPVPCVIRGMSARMAGDGPSSWTVYAMVSRPRTGEFSRWGTLDGAYVGGRQPGAENGRGKPLWLTDQLVRDYTRAGDLVCDPLAGYGGTLISAIDAGRRAIGAELDHAAYDEAHRRAARPRATDDNPTT